MWLSVTGTAYDVIDPKAQCLLAVLRCCFVLETILQNTCQLNAPLVTHMLV